MTSGAKGIVFAGTGAGFISSLEQSALKGVLPAPVLSRPSWCAPIERETVASSPAKNTTVWVFNPADTLNPRKARILLMLALTKTNDFKEIKRIFAEY